MNVNGQSSVKDYSMSFLSEVGDYLLDKAGESIENSVNDFFKEKLGGIDLKKTMKFIQEVVSGGDSQASVEQTDDKDYQHREHFKWETNNKFYKGFLSLIHNGRILEGSELNAILYNNQRNLDRGGVPLAKGGKIDLNSFRQMLDTSIKNGQVASNKGYLRLIQKGGTVKLDSVGTNGFSDLFVGFRCNMTAEHNRQTRALFVDSVMTDLKKIFPQSASKQSGQTGMGLLMAKAGVLKDIEGVYDSLKGLLSMEKTIVDKKDGGDGKTKVQIAAQKFKMQDAAKILAQYDRVLFGSDTIDKIFNTLLQEGCQRLGQTGTSEDVAKLFDTIKGDLGLGNESYASFITGLKEGRDSGKVGGAINAFANTLEKYSREELCKQEINFALEKGGMSIFQEQGEAYYALQTTLIGKARELCKSQSIGNLGTAEVLTDRFMTKVLPFMLEKAHRDGEYRKGLDLGLIKKELETYFNHLAEQGEAEKPTNFSLAQAMLTEERNKLQRELGDLRAKRQPDVEPDDESLAMENRIESNIQDIDDNLEWIDQQCKAAGGTKQAADMMKGMSLSAEKKSEFASYIEEGLKATDETVAREWSDRHYAVGRFGNVLNLSESLAKVKDGVVDTYRKQVRFALSANDDGETGTQKMISEFGRMLMDPSFIGSMTSKKLDKMRKESSAPEGSSKLDDPTMKAVEGLMESLVKAMVRQKGAKQNGDKIVETLKERVKFIAGQLKTASENVMKGDGGKVIKDACRNLRHYCYSEIKLPAEDATKYINMVKRNLAQSVGESLYKSFTAGLDSILEIEDKTEFKKALESQLKAFQKRAEADCSRLTHAAIYSGVLKLGYTGEAQETQKTGSSPSPFKNGEAVGKAFVDANKKFLDSLPNDKGGAGGGKDVDGLSSYELKNAFGGISKHVWCEVVVRNAQDKKTGFMGMVQQFSESLKDLNPFKGKDAGPAEPVEVSQEWVGKLKDKFETEMKSRLDTYRKFEGGFIRNFDAALAEKLKNEPGLSETVKDWDAESLAALAADIRRQQCMGVVGNVLKDFIDIPTKNLEGANMDLLVQNAIRDVSTDMIEKALGSIKGALQVEFQNASDASVQLSLKDVAKGMMPHDEKDRPVVKLVSSSDIPQKFSNWACEKAKKNLNANPLIKYTYVDKIKSGSMSTADIVAAEGVKLLDGFADGINKVVDAAEASVEKFAQRDQRHALGSVQKVLAGFEPKASTAEGCLLELEGTMHKTLNDDLEEIRKANEVTEQMVKDLRKEYLGLIDSFKKQGLAISTKTIDFVFEELEQLAKKERSRVIGENLSVGNVKGAEQMKADNLGNFENKVMLGHYETAKEILAAYKDIANRVNAIRSEYSRKSLVDGILQDENVKELLKAVIPKSNDARVNIAYNEEVKGTARDGQWFVNEIIKQAIDMQIAVVLGNPGRFLDDATDQTKFNVMIKNGVVTFVDEATDSMVGGRTGVINAYNDSKKDLPEIESVANKRLETALSALIAQHVSVNWTEKVTGVNTTAFYGQVAKETPVEYMEKTKEIAGQLKTHAENLIEGKFIADCEQAKKGIGDLASKMGLSGSDYVEMLEAYARDIKPLVVNEGLKWLAAGQDDQIAERQMFGFVESQIGGLVNGFNKRVEDLGLKDIKSFLAAHLPKPGDSATEIEKRAHERAIDSLANNNKARTSYQTIAMNEFFATMNQCRTKWSSTKGVIEGRNDSVSAVTQFVTTQKGQAQVASKATATEIDSLKTIYESELQKGLQAVKKEDSIRASEKSKAARKTTIGDLKGIIGFGQQYVDDTGRFKKLIDEEHLGKLSGLIEKYNNKNVLKGVRANTILQFLEACRTMKLDQNEKTKDAYAALYKLWSPYEADLSKFEPYKQGEEWVVPGTEEDLSKLSAEITIDKVKSYYQGQFESGKIEVLQKLITNLIDEMAKVNG